MLYPAHCRKNVPLHLALQPRKILFYKIAPSQITVNKIILNYLQFQIIFFCTQKSISNAGPPSERCSYRRVRLRFDQIANASNAESADNAKHLCNNNVSASEPRPFLRFSFLTVVVQPVRKYVVKSRGSRLICFPRQVLWQIRRATNALSFQLLTLIAAYWLRIGPIVRPYQPPFSIFIISFWSFCRKCPLKKGYKLLNYDRSPLFDLIESFLHSRSLIAYGLVGRSSKNHFYLENCPAFNGSPVTCLRTCLSKVEFQEHAFFLLTVFGTNIYAMYRPHKVLQAILQDIQLLGLVNCQCGCWIRRAGHVWYRWSVVCPVHIGGMPAQYI